jgi:hypothetical protein
VQAQDARSAPLALRARAPWLSGADVAAARTDERELVMAWLVRGTLHLVHREDHAWLLALTAPRQAATSRRRLAQEGVGEADAERAMTVIARALAADGPLGRAELAARVAAHGIRSEGQAGAHLVLRAALQGLVVLGPDRDGRPAIALARDWLGPPPRPPSRQRSLAELARRYLAAHGPATERDLSWWSGLPVADARAGLRAIGRSLREERGGLVDLADREPPAPSGVLLLPAHDEYLLGWRERDFALAPAHGRRVHPGGGILRACMVDDGEVVATWGLSREGGALRVTVRPLPGREVDLPRDEIADLARFEGLERAEGTIAAPANRTP